MKMTAIPFGTTHWDELPVTEHPGETGKVPGTDLRLSSAPFRREVQSKLADIPYGTTASYAQVATNAGRPKAVRAVGSACATNPLPIVLPCHRVVRRDGGYGNYLGGEEAKRFLLDHEHAHAPAAACG